MWVYCINIARATLQVLFIERPGVRRASPKAPVVMKQLLPPINVYGGKYMIKIIISEGKHGLMDITLYVSGESIDGTDGNPLLGRYFQFFAELQI